MAVESSVNTIKNNLSAHQGEVVLVVARKWEQTGWDMPSSATPYAFKGELHLGIATDPFIKYRAKIRGLEIFTPEHAVSIDWLRRDEVSLENGSIRVFDRTSADILNQRLGPKPGRRLEVWGGSSGGKDEAEDKLAFEVIAGDQAVTKWFLDDASSGRMLSYERELLERHAAGEAVDPWYISHIQKTNLDLNSLIGYQRMRSALGLTAAALPQELAVKVTDGMNQRKLVIVETIENFYDQDGELQRALEEIQRLRLPRITFGNEPHYERQVQYDEKDLKRIKFAAVGQQRLELESKLQRAVRAAVSWGLHLQPWVITRESSMPGKKIQVDVPVLVRNLAQYFEIPLVEKRNKPKS